MKTMVGVVVAAMLLFAVVGVVGAQQKSNPDHRIDLSTATSTVDRVTNAGAVRPSTITVQSSTGTVQGSTSTVHITTPPPGSIPGSGGRPSKSPPPPPPSSNKK